MEKNNSQFIKWFETPDSVIKTIHVVSAAEKARSENSSSPQGIRL